jgi:hypothetical protein
VEPRPSGNNLAEQKPGHADFVALVQADASALLQLLDWRQYRMGARATGIAPA